MIKYTERNAKNSHTRSQLELMKSKLVLNKSNLQTNKIPYKQEEKKIRQCCLIRAAFKCVIFLTLVPLTVCYAAVLIAH